MEYIDLMYFYFLTEQMQKSFRYGDAYRHDLMAIEMIRSIKKIQEKIDAENESAPINN